MSRKIKDSEFLCLSAILRAKEAKLLTRADLDRILNEPSFDDACRVVAEAGIGDMTGMNAKGVNEALAAYRARELAEISEIIPDPGILDLFRMLYGYHNAKVIVKSKGDLSQNAYMLSESCRYDVEDLLEVYRDDEAPIGALPAAYVAAIREAKHTLARTNNPMLADFIIDKAYYSEQLREAAKFNKPYVVNYVRHRIDKANLRSTLRTLYMGKRRELLQYALMEGGTISIDEILGSMDTKDDLVRLYSSSIYYKAAEAPNMTEFEKAADNAEKDYVLSGNYIAFGPEVVLEYGSALENEITSLRIILTGKLMGIDSAKLRERLRESYV